MKYIKEIPIVGVTFPITGSEISRQLNLRRIRSAIDDISIVAEKSIGNFGQQIRLVAINEKFPNGLELGYIGKDIVPKLFDRDLIIAPEKIIGGGEINMGMRITIMVFEEEQK